MQNHPPALPQTMADDNYSCSNSSFMFLSSSSSSSSTSEISPIMHHHHPSSWTLPQPYHRFNPVLLPPAPHVPSPPSSQSSHNGLHFSYEGNTTWSSTEQQLRLQMVQPGSDPFRIQTDQTGKMTAQEKVDAKAVAASKSHSEAERRRRERINNHLTKLRSILPSTTKTDKASLLAEVIQHMKELKRQTSIITEQNQVPTEVDELTIDNTFDEEGRTVIRASLCCEDRSDLLPDLIKTLKMFRLRTLKAEITTLGRRVKNVLFVTRDDYQNGNDNQQKEDYSITVLKEALEAVVEKTFGNESSFGSVKRQRTNYSIDMLEQHMPL